MKTIRETFYGLFHNKVDASGLAVFRMLFSMMLMCEAVQLFRFRHIVYDRIPFVSSGEFKFELFFSFWIPVLLLLFFGLFTRFATILNYIFAVLVFSSASEFEYHVFYTYVGVSFFMMFMPVSRALSLDNVIRTIKYTNIGRPYFSDRKVLEINYLVPVFVGVALIYFDSIFLKATSKMWINGLGVWLPSSIPLVVWNDTSWLLNCKALVIFLGYFVLAFELLFIFLFWFKKWRLPLMIIGISFHLGIFFSYPIPLFALTYIIIYLLLIPANFWLRLGRLFNTAKPVYKFYYDVECPLCAKTVAVVRQLDIFGRVDCTTVQVHATNDPALSGIDEGVLLLDIHGVTGSGKVYRGYDAYVRLFKSMIYLYPLGLLMAIPGINLLGKKIYRKIAGDRLTQRCTVGNCKFPVYEQPISEEDDFLVEGFSKIGITRKFWKYSLIGLFITQLILIAATSTENPTVAKVVSAPKAFLAKFLGVCRHTVFLDFHFYKYNHIVKIDYIDPSGDRHLVPLIDDRGMVSDYNSGIIWRNISFNVVKQIMEKETLSKGLVNYMRHYLRENNFSTTNATFIISVKEFDTPKEWERDFLTHQIAKQWTEAGKVTLDEKSFEVEWTSYMEDVFMKEQE